MQVDKGDVRTVLASWRARPGAAWSTQTMRREGNGVSMRR